MGLLARLRRLHRDITLVWADGGCIGGLVDWAREQLALSLRVADELPLTGPGLREKNGEVRGDDPVVDGHTDEQASGTAMDRRPALNAPDAFRRSHPRSARRLAFDRTPSTFADVASRPIPAAVS